MSSEIEVIGAGREGGVEVVGVAVDVVAGVVGRLVHSHVPHV